jgi:mannose-6-phosphate isomerase-like protein (cupin superfamily)
MSLERGSGALLPPGFALRLGHNLIARSCSLLAFNLGYRRHVMAEDSSGGVVVDLMSLDGVGPVWGMASGGLNATVLVWPAHHKLVEHTNTERDVLLIVLEGDVVATVEGRAHAIAAGQALLIEKGKSRSLRAGVGGVRYLSVHVRRVGIQIEERAPADR